MTFFIISTFVIGLLVLYTSCIIASRCSKNEELQEIEVIVDEIESHNT